MTTCASCGSDVTGKKFCQQCGTPVQAASAPAAQHSATTCLRCNGAVNPGAAFCMHCGTSLGAQAVAATAPSQPLTHTCIACHAAVPIQSAFCTSCGQNMQAAAAPQVAPAFCVHCGHHNDPGVRFCAGCGQPVTAAAAPQTQYGAPQYPQSPYGQPGQTQQYPQPPYGQPAQYGQPGYQPQPMLGQPPMVLRCPVCMAMSPLGSTNCPSCRTSLANIVPTPANIPVQGQQGMLGGLGGMMQGNAGKYAMGALGGAAAVIGGEMLLHGVENNIAHRVEDDEGYGYGRHHHREEGGLGELGNLANDIGLF